MLAGLQNAYGTPYWTSRGFPLGGLGCGCSQTDDTGTCLDPDPCDGPMDSPPLVDCPGSPGCPGYIPTGPAASRPFNWGVATSVANTFAKDFSTIFRAVQPVPAGCTQVAGPYGTSTSCSQAGQQAPALNLSSGVSAYLPWLIGGGLVLFAVKAFSGGSR
jgi:hypothetical protein